MNHSTETSNPGKTNKLPESRSLRELCAQLQLAPLSDIPDFQISGITADSRQVQAGWAFVAIQGSSTDGHSYIPKALERGARLIVSERPAQPELQDRWLQLEGDMHAHLAWLAAAFYDFPARKLTVIGVTGTDGKTSTASILHQLLVASGLQAGLISTVSARIGAQEIDTGFHVTTPDAPDIQRYLAQMVQAGMSHCVLETTSHGLAQGRVIACEYDIAIVTNVTHEHLDYHGSYENYLQAKGLLFESLKTTQSKPGVNPRLAILNKDDRSYGYLKRVSPPGFVSYSILNQAELWADGIENRPDGLSFTCHIGEQAYPTHCSLVGNYNVANCLAALSACIFGLKLDPKACIAQLQNLQGVPGRMERIDLGQDFTAIVDFAHTPNAMARALETVRSLTKGRIIAVFGSAGLRDREKRRMMPEVAVQRADICILTAEDPRTEALSAILEDMAQGAIAGGGVEGQSFFRIGDRREALRKAVNLARPGDLVITLGKGHEQSMCFGTQEYLWDDRTALRSAISERLGLPGAEMPFLPDAE